MKYRSYIIPLQAFAALFVCSGIAWMVVMMAGFNPSPPTAMDIKMRSTADVSFVSMNSTAAALAVEMVSELMPTAIVLAPTVEIEDTAMPTSTLSYALIPVSGPSHTPSPTPFSLFSAVIRPTKTRERAASRTPIWTATLPPTTSNTSEPTLVPTNTRTATPIPTALPTDTYTPDPPTVTTEPPATDTNTPEPPPTDTDTAEPPATNTSEPPPTSTNEPPPTDTPIAP